MQGLVHLSEMTVAAYIAGRAFDQSEVVGTELARTAFAIALGDDRLGELFPGLCGAAEPSHQVQ